MIWTGFDRGWGQILITIVQIVYLAVSFIPPLARSSAWMNWLMCGTTRCPGRYLQYQCTYARVALGCIAHVVAQQAVVCSGLHSKQLNLTHAMHRVLVTPVFSVPLMAMVAHYPRLEADAGSVGNWQRVAVKKGYLDRVGCF